MLKKSYNKDMKDEADLSLEFDDDKANAVFLEVKKVLKNGEFERVIEIIKYNNLKDIMSQVLLADCYLMLGEIVVAVEKYNSIIHKFSKTDLKEDEYEHLSKAKQAAKFYRDIGFDEYNIYLEGRDVIQSIERSDESYPESDYYESIIKCRNKSERDRMMEDLFSEKVLINSNKREKSYFTLGEFYFGSDELDHYLKAFAYYYDAIKLNPNKALYYGYASNSLYKYLVRKQINGEAEDELVYILGYRSAKFAIRAIELDPENPRWYFYRQLALSSLIVHNRNFIRQAIKDNQTALRLCREDQKNLEKAILKSLETLNNTKDIFDSLGGLNIVREEINIKKETQNQGKENCKNNINEDSRKKEKLEKEKKDLKEALLNLKKKIKGKLNNHAGNKQNLTEKIKKLENKSKNIILLKATRKRNISEHINLLKEDIDLIDIKIKKELKKFEEEKGRIKDRLEDIKF